ncbi:MAG: hypothetical protein K0R47_836 [Brevibacillus sp.]|nr:hypothetical protein [Brevibacillus sp.]
MIAHHAPTQALAHDVAEGLVLPSGMFGENSIFASVRGVAHSYQAILQQKENWTSSSQLIVQFSSLIQLFQGSENRSNLILNIGHDLTILDITVYDDGEYKFFSTFRSDIT